MTEDYGSQKSLEEDYRKRNPICDGSKCINIKYCVMDMYGPEINKIISGLVKITLEANGKIMELFDSEKGKDKLPANSPIFKLRMIYCPNQKIPEIDIDV